MEGNARAARQTLPGRFYTDPEWFAGEMEHIFASMWIAVGRVEEIATRGAFVCRDVAGASIIIVNDSEGLSEAASTPRARAFHNVCRHRGTRLCDSERGVFPGSIQCPYHAWTYDLSGRLIGAPLMDDVADFSRNAYPLRDVRCEVWDGHLFVNLSDSTESLLDQLCDLPQRFAPWRMHELQMVCRVCYDVKANWKLIVQNYNECLHCPVIHPMLNRMHHYLGAANVPTRDTYCGGAMGFKEGVETLSVDGRRRREFLPGLGADERHVVNYFAIYPNLLLTLHPDYVVTVTIWPQTAGETRLVCEWHFHPTEIARPGFVAADAIEFWDRTNREDWAISERSYKGISSRGYRPGLYSNRETQLWEFDQFVLNRVGRANRDAVSGLAATVQPAIIIAQATTRTTQDGGA